jgi:signal peptidase II
MAPKFQVGLTAFFISLALDILTKHLVVSNLTYADRIPVIEGFFYLTHVRNTGAAFGLFQDAPVTIRLTFFIGISAVAIAIIIQFFRKLAPGDRLSALALASSSAAPSVT